MPKKDSNVVVIKQNKTGLNWLGVLLFLLFLLWLLRFDFVRNALVDLIAPEDATPEEKEMMSRDIQYYSELAFYVVGAIIATAIVIALAAVSPFVAVAAALIGLASVASGLYKLSERPPPLLLGQGPLTVDPA